jgi:Ser/Thr protein kinase RdoA (MazF antagonist)
VLTHDVSLDPEREVVIKRYRQYNRGEPAREWRALQLLAEHAPGLAPEPLRADLETAEPVIEMTLLPGEPLGRAPLTQDQEAALVRALGQLWQSVPVDRIIPVAGEQGNNEAQLVQEVRQLVEERPDLGGDPLVLAAYAAGVDWLTWAVTGAGDPAGRQPVFGQGDANLANFLWDGERVRIVDFEDSGVSDRALELAMLIEHISAWLGAGLGSQFIQAFDLTPAERSRLAYCRRLAGLHWLLFLRPGSSASERNPPGTLRYQAERLLALF